MSTLIERLKRRKLGQWGLAYLAFSVAILGVQDAVAGPLQLSDTVQQAVLIVLLFGLPLVLVLAWYHGDQGQQRLTGSELLMIAVIIAGAGVSVSFLPPGTNAPASESLEDRESVSVAVLPFDDLGPDPGSVHFADAMTHELSLRLSRIDGIRVRSARSMARFKGTELDVTEIADELGVSHILEGGVQWAGDQARLTVQLTDASTGFEDWSEAFDGASSDPLSLSEEMALRVANSLDLHLSPIEAEAMRAHYTENPEAWSAFHQGWAFLESTHADATYSEAKLARAEEYFSRALSLDSLYAPALAGMSLTHAFVYFAGIDTDPGRQARAEELALRALEIDDMLPEAHIALGQARFTQRDHLAAAEGYEEALRLEDDNAMAWCLLAYVCNVQDPQDAVRAEHAARESLSRDPTWFLSYHQLGWALRGQGRYEEAEVALLDGLVVNSEYRPTYTVLGPVQLELGKYEEALATLQKAISLGQSPTELVYLGAAQVMTGELAGGLDSIERALALGFDNFDAIEGSPYFEVLRDDPRLRALLEEYRVTGGN